MDWIVFGDDWGAHPSTTQHLVLNLPQEDRVIWVNSIGMRTPNLSLADAKRVWRKAKGMLSHSAKSEQSQQQLYKGSLGKLAQVHPKVIPWHLNPAITRFNVLSLRRSLKGAMQQLNISDPVLLSSSPVTVRYVDAVPYRKLAYLRLDVYDHLPGCDVNLVRQTENTMYQQADVVFATAKILLPTGQYQSKAHYLPQGVQVEHFATIPLQPSGQKIIGFFGIVAPWLDFDLIEQVAKQAPDWQFEFVGKVDCRPGNLESLPNVHFRPPVPFSALPAAMSKWSAAWVPFLINELTEGVNPLKVREYLAAGLASLSTPMPEVQCLSEHVKITQRADEVVAWLQQVIEKDSAEARLARRQAVAQDSWANRALEMRSVMSTE